MANTNIKRTDPASDRLDPIAEKSDTVDLTRPIRGIHINAAGTLYGIMADDTTNHMETWVMLAGMYYPYALKRVGASTTITDAVGLI